MASAWPTGPAEFSKVIFSAVKSSASMTVDGVRKVPIGFPSRPMRLAFRSNVRTVVSEFSPTNLKHRFYRCT